MYYLPLVIFKIPDGPFYPMFVLFVNLGELLKVLWQEEVEDTKGVIIIRISKKKRQHNGQKKKYKRTNNDLQNMHIKLKIE